MPLEWEPLGECVGAMVMLDRDALLGGRHADELRGLLRQRGVLLFREAHFDEQELESFSATLGEPEKIGDHTIFKFTFEGAEGESSSDYTQGTFAWHIDRLTQARPNWASVLTARQVSRSGGGETEFANASAAWADMPESRKASLASLKIVHSIEAGMRLVRPEAPDEERERWRSWGSRSQPLVKILAGGKPSLLIGATADKIEGMHEAASRALLDELLAWATQPRYVYSHSWRVGDVVMWDNIGILHRARPYDRESGRLMHRITLHEQDTAA